MAVKVDKDKCNGCGPCEEACPVEAIKVVDNLAVVNEDECTDCGACIEACPNAAISEG
jgi:ferredoxin